MTRLLTRLWGALLATLLFTTASAAPPIAHGSASNVKVNSVNAAFLPASSEWTYTVRPGENLQQLASNLLRTPYDSFQLLQYNQLSSASAVRPGNSLKIPMDWLRQQPEPALALAITGNVHYKPQTRTQFIPLLQSTPLNVGDEVRTANGFAVIRLADQSIIRLGPDSTLVFNRLTQFGKTGMADTRLRLERGRLNTQVQPLADQSSRFEIATPSAVAAVRGTAFSLSVLSPDKTRLAVTEGQVAFGSEPLSVLVPAGFGAISTPLRKPDILPLAGAPALAALPEQINQLPLDVRWGTPANGKQAYQLDVINPDNGRWSQQTLQTPQTALQDLSNGNYQLQVAALDAQGFPGMPALASLEVALEAEAAQLVSPEQNARMDPDRLQFNWQLLASSNSARVEIADNSAFEPILARSDWTQANAAQINQSLDPGTYFWRVATLAGETSRNFSPTRSFILEGLLPIARVISMNYVDNQVSIFWQKIVRANGYQLQLSKNADFSEILKEEHIADTSVALRLRRGERYYVRLKGVAEAPMNSQWGPGRELYVP